MPKVELPELTQFLEAWKDNGSQTKKAFQKFQDCLENMADVDLSFNARPGVTYSLRAHHKNQTKREMFGMVDVIDDDPENRWLSVCFFTEMVSDPDEVGDWVPEGLAGEDATCFDVDEWEDSLVAYVEARLKEAGEKASQGD